MVAVLVNGLPGAGKTTLGRAVARELGVPLFSKDLVKETHADVLAAELAGLSPRRRSAVLGAAAGETLWTLLAEAPAGAVLESWWPVGTREFVTRGLGRAGGPRVVELWCDVPPEVARRRYEARHPRHPVHRELPTDQEWENWRRGAQPLCVGPVIRLDTTGPVDTAALAARIREQSQAADPLTG